MNVVDKIAFFQHTRFYLRTYLKTSDEWACRILPEGSWQQKEQKTKDSLERPTPEIINEMTALSVNITSVVNNQNSRKGENPNLIEYKRLYKCGADGITVHPRPDQRHVKPSDLPGLKDLINKHTNIEFNIEGNPFEEAKDDYLGLLELVKRSRPHQCTLCQTQTN